MLLADLTHRVATGALSREEVARAMDALLDSAVGNEAKAAFLRTWAERGETAPELAACAEALLPRASDPGVRGTWHGKPLLDCCGTGGGGLNLLNISTGIVFILAAMGIPVVKHGNRGQTKKSGSADVLETLGIRIDLPPEKLEPCLEEIGAAFLFAPAYHTSFSVLAPVRKQLGAEGRRTVFNLLGPLLNPVRPDARLVGVFKQEHLTLYRDTLWTMDCRRFTIVCGETRDGKPIGEASADGGINLLATSYSNQILQESRSGYDAVGLDLTQLHVRDAVDSAQRLEAILSGEEKSLGSETLIYNAALAAVAQGLVPDINQGRQQARDALDSGRALAVLKRWQAFSREGLTMRPYYRFAYTLVGLHLKLLHSIRIEGRENIPDEACLIVGNHASFLDPTTIGWAIAKEIYFLGRRDLFRPPVLSWLLPMCNVLPIDREGNDISGLRGIIKRLKSGQSILVFPEGTRSPDGTLQPAEPGAGLLAVKGGVRVLPTRVFGTHEAFPRGAKFPRPHPLRVVVGKPYWPTLPATGKPSYQAIADEMMAKIAELH